MPDPACPTEASFEPAVLPADAEAALAALADGIEELEWQPELARYLPQITAEWSALARIQQRHEEKEEEGGSSGSSLPALLLEIKREMNEQAAGRAPGVNEETTASPTRSSRSGRPSPPPWDDWRANVRVYLAAVGARFSKEITWDATMASNFELPLWWELHTHVCAPCSKRGDYITAVIQGNASNPCEFSVILAWLAGQYRLPWTDGPPPPMVGDPNHSSFDACPESMAKPQEELIASFLRPLQPGERALATHPMLAVVRRHEVLDALRILRNMGEPYEGVELAGQPILRDVGKPYEDPTTAKGIDGLNRHIRRVQQQSPSLAKANKLEQVKVRPCVDMTSVNKLLHKLPFSYCTITDAAACILPHYLMIRIDLRKAFNQFPVHPDDALYMCVVIEGVTYVPKRALFGGSPFPHYISTAMGAVKELLGGPCIRVPIRYMIDDVFLWGTRGPATDPASAPWRKNEAEQRMQQLGFILNEEKSLGPSPILPFLGVTIDAPKGALSVPYEKLENYLVDITDTLAGPNWRSRDADSIVGRLGWVSVVMQAGRPRLRRIQQPIIYGPRRPKWQDIQLAQRSGLEWFCDAFTARVERQQRLWAPFWPQGPPPIGGRISSRLPLRRGWGGPPPEKEARLRPRPPTLEAARCRFTPTYSGCQSHETPAPMRQVARTRS